jgi:S-adenosylmethionine:tRNA ribosyltransferase-isomerase
MLTSDYNYDLPKELIAQFPPENRGESRLLVYHRDTGKIEHKQFQDLIDYLLPTDILVVNNSRVIPARLWATDPASGKSIELLLILRINDKLWTALTRPAKLCQVGTTLSIGHDTMLAKIVDIFEGSRRQIEFSYTGDWNDLLAELGEMPVPPYIKRKSDTAELKQLDKDRYQTVYAKYEGSIAAPTAGLHFSEELLKKITDKGIKIAAVTLHVGVGTFQPVRAERIADHKIEPEYYSVLHETAEMINTAKKNQQRIVVVGTTATRTLETVADEHGIVSPGEGWASIFIYPGYKFKVADVLLTNFHLPQSTLLMLASAFAGKEKLLQVFYSYGDAMLII